MTSSHSSPPQDSTEGPRLESLGLGGFVVELLLPTTLSAALLLTAARNLPWWDLHGRLGIGAFGVLLVALSLVLSVWVDGRTLARRQRAGNAQLLNRAGAKARLVKFVLGGIVIPLAVFGTANLVRLPGSRTPMSVAAELAVKKSETPREERLGSVVLRSRDSAVKVAGISALRALGSAEALDQLFRILAGDPAVMQDGLEAQALTKAIASYGKAAVPGLQACFAKVGQAAPTSSQPAPDGKDLASLVMQTLLEMGPAEAADLLPFARRVAADSACTEGVRGRALLLVARLGGENDLDLLYEQLNSPSPLLQTRALEAIATLSDRLASKRDGSSKAP